MATLSSINRLHKLASKELFTIDSELSYDRITDLFITLSNAVENCADENWIYIGELEYSLFDMIIGAYWHFTEWHSGQYSNSYAALCALGNIFRPNMTTSEPENDSYIALNDIAQAYFDNL